VADLFLADRSHFGAVAALVNAAYRGGEAGVGWTHERDLVEGPRTSAEDLEREVAAPEETLILCMRDEADGPVRACVLLRRHADHCYLGMLSVAPSAQDRGLGRVMIEHSEAQARAWGRDRIVMTVLDVRDSLIAWYERRGYTPTGEKIPFPYGNKSLGRPRVGNLSFVVLEKKLPA
jgi:ribosomal protein S18 acetylase RimI-like enzyme